MGGHEALMFLHLERHQGADRRDSDAAADVAHERISPAIYFIFAINCAQATAVVTWYCAMKLLLSILVLTTSAAAADADAICARAVELHRSGDITSAIGQYESCLAAKPELVELRSNYGAALARIGRYRDAIEQYSRALAAAPGNPQLRYNLVLAYYKQGEIGKAAETLLPLHEAAPDNMQVNLLLADCYLRLGEMERIIDLLGPLEAAHREDAGFAYLLGTALIRSGQVKRGEAVVDRILRDSNSPEAHFLVGSAAFFRQEYPQAVQEFAKTTELNPALPSVWSFYGLSLLYTGDAKAAEAAFRRELEANPNDYESNVKLGAILAVGGKDRDALPYLEHALLVRPSSGEARSELIPVYEHLARKDDARRLKAELDKMPKPAAKDETGLLAAGTPAPPFRLPAANGKAEVALAELLRKGPVVLVFGSYTCPQFRFGAPSINRLYEKYRARLPFVMIYVQEAHGGPEWQSTMNQRDKVDQPPAANLDEKRGYALACARKLNITYLLAADRMDRGVENAYQGWPSAAYVIGKDSRVLWSSRLGEFAFRPAEMEKAITESLR